MPTTQALDFTPTTATPAAVVPISGAADWVVAIAAGGLTVLDVSSEGDVETDPSSIAHSSRRLLTRPVYGGTTLRIRMQYDNSDTLGDDPSPPLTIRVFGQSNATGYTVLRNLNGDTSVPIPTDPSTDCAYWNGSAGGDVLITQPDNNAHSWDCDGCNKFLIAVERTYQPDSGSPSVAFLEAKIV